MSSVLADMSGFSCAGVGVLVNVCTHTFESILTPSVVHCTL